MTAVGAAAPVAKLSFGPVIQGTFGVLKRNFGTFVALMVLLETLPMLLVGAGMLQTSSGFTRTNITTLSLGYLLSFVAAAVLTPAVVHGTVADLNGQKPKLAECLQSGLQHAMPVFVIMLLSILGAMLGFILLIVPGVILLLAWSVAGPCQVVERTGILGAFGRSRALTKGSRWRLFWLFVLYSIVNTAVQQSLLGVAGMIPGPAVFGSAVPGTASPFGLMTPAAAVVMMVVGAAGALISYTALAVIYYELRRLKEGIGPEALASVFD